ncbi:MAG: Rne/Rng family ribonuclease [Desulfarculus sp.]|nr:Rne/Rng family ribonuclease [Desulfarculus sp.]
MVKKMLINAGDPEELRVALVEDGRLEAFYVETAAREQTRGNIYKGVVANVEPSLQAAFIDYGAPRHGFLQISDVRPDLFGPKAPDKGLPPIQEVLRRGQEVLVQVVKEETGNKGASLTTYFSIPGQSLVLTPGHMSQGVSRKIESEAERTRLKSVVAEMQLGEDLGIIARTASEGRSKRDLLANAKLLQRLWEDIQKRGKQAKAPALIHREEELAVRTVRDLFTSEVEEVLVDDPEVFARLEDFISLVNPRRKKALKLYREKRPIFAKYDIEQQLESIYQPLVRLDCGGSIVIQPTEALVSVDVNSGKAIKGKEIEETALVVNLEAASEIARQLRLRDLGGLIVIDFIDMRDRKHQAKVQKALKDELKKDKAKVTVGRISRFGLLELSRQRIRPPIDFGATRICPTCQGRGMLRTIEALGRAALRQLGRKIARGEGCQRVRLAAEVANYLQNAKRAELAELEAKTGVCLEVVADQDCLPEEVHLERGEGSWPLPAPAEEPRQLRTAAPPAARAAEPAPDLEEEPEADEPPEPPAPASQGDKPKARSRSRSRRSRKPAAAKATAEAPAQTEAQPTAGSEASTEAVAAAAASENEAPPLAGEGAGGEASAKKRRGRRRSGSARRRSRARKAAAQQETETGGPASPTSQD